MTRTITVVLFLALATSAWSGPIEDVAVAKAKSDIAADLKKFRTLADQGVALAQVYIGIYYADGIGVSQDYVEAAKWYRLAAAQGDAAAQNGIGFAYGTGSGVVQDYVESAKWYRLAAEQGDAAGQFNLGLMYSKGQGISQDYIRAHMWVNLSAVSGTKDSVRLRDAVAKVLTSQQIGEAQKLARECQARQFKGC